MRSGRKIHLVNLLKPTGTKSSVGDKSIDYVQTHQAYAGIEPGGKIGGRKYQDDQDNTFDRVLIVLDYYPDFAANWQIEHVETGMRYKIHRMVNPELRNRELQCECSSISDI